MINNFDYFAYTLINGFAYCFQLGDAYANKDKFLEPVAQLVEQKTFNLWVLGSSPSGLTHYI